MDIKNVLKTLKLNESLISMILGALVILVVGVLTVNYFRNRQEAPQPVATQNQSTEQKAEEGKVPEGLPQTHKVEKGESLWTIAERYYNSGYNWTDIASANKLTNVGVIEEGQELTLPQVEAKMATVVVAQTPEATPTQAPTAAEATPTPEEPTTPSTEVIGGETYKVVRGDHLWGIAVRAYGDGYRWVEIARVNKLTNPNLIFVDQELALPRAEATSGK